MDSQELPIVLDSTVVEAGPVRSKFPWVYAFVLTVLSVIGSILVVPFSADLTAQIQPLVKPLMPLIMTIQVVFEIAISLLMIALGLGLGRSLGLIWPPLDGWDAGPERGRRFRSALTLATALGVVSAAMIVGLGYAVDPFLTSTDTIKLPPWWANLLGSIGAGIREEVWLRLGIMTFLAWVGARLTRQTAPGAAIIWSANLLACLLFGAIHLPQAFAFFGFQAALLVSVLVGNGVPGMIFGWLYWRKGLVAAMVCHAVTDIVFKVIVPLATS